uniref:Protein containing Tmemb 9 domain n=1 Tax=Rhipicephalus zambeziensis TaxID=60191 RepID=A0A224Z6L4_9ACAR
MKSSDLCYLGIALVLLAFVHCCDAQYEDVRCKCICPSTAVVKGSQTNRKLYIMNVPPQRCNCEGVILPQANDIKGRESEFCPRCKCRYERRNTTTIRVLVILIIWVISLLSVYMLFLMCLDPLLNRRKAASAYQEHVDEELHLEEPLPVHQQRTRRSSSSVLNKVGQQQDKWKRQVQEQRRNIYDKHTMLN